MSKVRPPSRAAKLARPQPRSALAAVTGQAEGNYYNLAEILVEVNWEYFEGQLAATIQWGYSLPRRCRPLRSFKEANCAQESRVITVSPVFDQLWVPRDYLKYLIFHELLHLKHPSRPPGPWRFHTKPFRTEERTFARYDWAVEWSAANFDNLLRGHWRQETARRQERHEGENHG